MKSCKTGDPKPHFFVAVGVVQDGEKFFSAAAPPAGAPVVVPTNEDVELLVSLLVSIALVNLEKMLKTAKTAKEAKTKPTK